VPPHDVGALSAALREIVEDDDAADALRRAGPPRAARFTWAACVEQHVAVYRQAAARVAA
jgi:glycosyltransferase involved in cell wall biosynthesis